MIKKIIQFFCIILVFFCIGCIGYLPVGSKEHKATILYFEGGSGKIKRVGDYGAKNRLICRAGSYFPSAGIKLMYKPCKFRTQGARISKKHFNDIQKTVNRLKSKGHNNIWLMGISNGAISISYAGENQIQNVEGLIAINPGAGGRYNYFSKIKLPFLLITHERDGGIKGYSPDFFSKYVCRNSVRAKNAIFKGGRVGTSREALGASQKYQHGLRGLEKEFYEVVKNFIFYKS